MKKILLLLFVTTLLNFIAQAQDSLKTVYPLYLDFPLIDLPFLKDAAKMNVNKQNQTYQSTKKPAFSNYLNAYESPSMQQALAITKDIHATNYYLNNKLWYNIVKPNNKKNKIWNRVLANASAGVIDLLFTYEGVVFSTQWMHEEFHRNGLTQRGIAAYDETYNRFNGGPANGSVSKVFDEDMVAFKKEAPQELVRSFSAGIESEFLLMRDLQKDNFFRKAQYPSVLLNILLTKHAVDYVNQFKRSDFNASIDSMNYHGGKVADRDFVGWDFTAWVYDLHRPNEPYEARGNHPNGPGINRAIKSTTLTTEEYNYLSKMGKMQYLNFLSPFMLGIDRIKINENTAFNFAVRHYLNSFGYDLSTDLMVDYKGKNYMFAFHGYRNKNQFFPGIEYGHPDLNVNVLNQKLKLQPIVMLWVQPKGQDFFTKKADLGGLLSLKAFYPVGKYFNAYVNVDTKTKGWVAGHPYLKANTGLRFGFSMDINSRI